MPGLGLGCAAFDYVLIPPGLCRSSSVRGDVVKIARAKIFVAFGTLPDTTSAHTVLIK